jgi:hypothetical protein
MQHRCPDEETLAAWFDGLLDPADEATLQRELLACPECATLLATLGLVLRDEPSDAWNRLTPPSAVTQRALHLWPAAPSAAREGLRLAVRWIEDRLAPLADALCPLQPATMALRGNSGADDLLRYHVNVGDLPLEIGLEIDGPEQVSVTIRPLSPPPSGILLRLSANGETRAMSTLSEEGTTVPALPTGTYELTVEQAEGELGRLFIELN